MLEEGNGGMTETEDRSHFSLWAMLAAPLFAGNDLRAMSEGTRATLASPEIVAIDQDPGGRQARRIRSGDRGEVWAKKLGDGTDHAVLLFNRREEPREIEVGWPELGLAGQLDVRDCWERRQLARAASSIALEVSAHGVAVLRLSPVRP
jgi:alpha-galactosidase